MYLYIIGIINLKKKLFVIFIIFIIKKKMKTDY